MLEIERRFLVAELPVSLPAPSNVVQAYVTTQPVSVRVRDQDGRFTLTIKTGSGMTRTEIERELEADEFVALYEVAAELRIAKRRHLVPLDGGFVAELDLFDGDLTGRRLVEVEFTTIDAAHAFIPPPWFGREVTTDRRYTNSSLARHGWPDE